MTFYIIIDFSTQQLMLAKSHICIEKKDVTWHGDLSIM